MRYAYADPPYLGCCSYYGHDHREPYGCWDDLEAHRRLINDLTADFPDGWALSLSSPSAFDLAPMCPQGSREPVIFYGGRKHRDRSEATVRDFLSANITLKRGLTGVKPPEFNQWILGLLGHQPGDQLVDLFPGKGGMADALAQGRLAV